MLEKIKQNWAKDMKANKEAVYGLRWGGQDVIDQLTDALEGEIRGNVFEIGCGGGRLTKWLFDMGADEVTACDVHQSALQRTKAYEPRAKVILSDGESIPANDKSFDLIFSWGVFLHLPEYLVQWYLMEAHRVADRLIFALPSFEQPWGRKSYNRFIEKKAWRNLFFTGYFNHYTECQGVKMCEYAGWRVSRMAVIRKREILYICEK